MEIRSCPPRGPTKDRTLFFPLGQVPEYPACPTFLGSFGWGPHLTDPTQKGGA